MLSLTRNQWSTAGTSAGSPVQGNRGGWQWNRVSPVVVCWSEFCAYSAQGRKLLPWSFLELRGSKKDTWVFTEHGSEGGREKTEAFNESAIQVGES